MEGVKQTRALMMNMEFKFSTQKVEQQPIKLLSVLQANIQKTEKNNSYDDLVILFEDWRLFEEPDLINGVHDYSVNSFDKKKPKYNILRERLEDFDISEWSISNQIDWHITVSYTHLTLPTNREV